MVIEEGNVADNAQAVREDGKLIGIAEMAVDIHLLGIRAGSGLGRHEPISHFIGVNIRFILVEGFQLPDKGIEGFRVVFGNIKLDGGSVKRKHLCEGSINRMADRLGIVNHLLEHEFDITHKILLEAGKKRGIRDFIKPTEGAEFTAEMEKDEQEGIRGYGEDFLEDEGRKETFQGIDPLPSEMPVKGMVKGLGDELPDVEMLPE